MASVAEKLNFKFYLISINLNFSSHIWPLAAILENTVTFSTVKQRRKMQMPSSLKKVKMEMSASAFNPNMHVFNQFGSSGPLGKRSGCQELGVLT